METAGNLPFHLWLWLFRWARRNVTSTTLQRSSEVLIMSLRPKIGHRGKQCCLHEFCPGSSWFQSPHGTSQLVQVPALSSPGPRKTSTTPCQWSTWSTRSSSSSALESGNILSWKDLESMGYNDGGCGCKAPQTQQMWQWQSDAILFHLISIRFYYMVSKTIEKVGSFMKFHEVSTSHMNSANCRNSVSSKDALKFCTSSIMFPCGCTSLNATLMG